MASSALIAELEKQFSENPRRAFEMALSLDPENLIALRYLGDIARDRGDLDDAREWYTRLLDVDPQNPEILEQLEALGGPPAPAALSEPSAGGESESSLAGDTVRTVAGEAEVGRPEFEPAGVSASSGGRAADTYGETR